MMSRRNGTGMKFLLTVVIGGVFVFGLYTYHDLQTKLRKADEYSDQMLQQKDSLSAQLQVVYEHKSRLEKSLHQEEIAHKKTRDDMTSERDQLEVKHASDRKELLDRISSINQEKKMMESQHEDTQADLTKLQDDFRKLQDDAHRESEQHTIEYQQLQQEKENELAVLRDELANVKRHNLQLSNQANLAIQNQEAQQHQLETDHQEILRLKQQLEDYKHQVETDHQENLHLNQRLEDYKHQVETDRQENLLLNQKLEDYKFQYGADPAQFDQLNAYNYDQQGQLLQNQQQQQQQMQQQPLQQQRLQQGYQGQQQQDFRIQNPQGYQAQQHNMQGNVQDVGIPGQVGMNQQFWQQQQQPNENMANNIPQIQQYDQNGQQEFEALQQKQMQNNRLPQDQLDIQAHNLQVAQHQSKVAQMERDLGQGREQEYMQRQKQQHDQMGLDINEGNMQINKPGDARHPGYHEVKDVEPAQQQQQLQVGQHAEDTDLNDNALGVEQVAAPNIQDEEDVREDQGRLGDHNGVGVPPEGEALNMPPLGLDNLVRNDQRAQVPRIIDHGGINQPNPLDKDVRAQMQGPLGEDMGQRGDPQDNQLQLPQFADNQEEHADEQGHAQGQMIPPQMVKSKKEHQMEGDVGLLRQGQLAGDEDDYDIGPQRNDIQEDLSDYQEDDEEHGEDRLREGML